MKYILSTAIAAVLMLSVNAVQAIPFIAMTIEDQNTLETEVYFDTATPGSIVVSAANSTLLSRYWSVGSLQTSLSNNITPAELGKAISASINLTATDLTGANLAVNTLFGDYRNPINGTYNFETVINASTVFDTDYSAVVTINGETLLSVFDIADTNTYTATAPFVIGGNYAIGHAFILESNAPGADLGFDISTRAVDGVTVPEPGALALLSLGLIGMTVARRVNRS